MSMRCYVKSILKNDNFHAIFVKLKLQIYMHRWVQWGGGEGDKTLLIWMNY